MYRNILEKKYKQLNGNRVKSLIKKKARNQINKLESNAFNITNDTINTILWQSEFHKLRRKLGKILSLEGKGAIAILPYKDSYILDAMHISNYTKIGKDEISVTLFNGSAYEHNGVDYNITTEYCFIDGVATLSRYIVVEDKRLDIEGQHTFPGIDFLPLKIFINNEDAHSDVEYAEVWEDLIRLDYFDNQLRAEWERTRTMPAYNTNFTDNDPKEHTKEIDNGKGYLEEDSFNAKLGNGTTMIPATTGTAVLQQQILFLEDDIKNKLGIRREQSGTKNRHNLEVVIDEQEALEDLLNEKVLRENQWQDFFDKLSTLTMQIRPLIKLELSKIEQAKLDLLEAQVLQEQMAADNKNSQISSQAEVGEEE